MTGTSIPSALGTMQGRAGRAGAKDRARRAFARAGGSSSARRARSPSRRQHVPAAGLGEQPGVFRFSAFPSLFQSRRIFGLNFLQYCTEYIITWWDNHNI